ncbi:MAG TPA: hypothetical protein VF691_07700 [Cytophagaceae bacterium]
MTIQPTPRCNWKSFPYMPYLKVGQIVVPLPIHKSINKMHNKSILNFFERFEESKSLFVQRRYYPRGVNRPNL